MENQAYLLSHLAGIFHTGVFCLQGERLTSYEENPEYNPIYSNQALRLALTRGANTQQEPYIISDNFHVLFLCVKREDQYYMMGPLSTRDMGRVERRRFYRHYGVGERLEKGLRYYTLMEVLLIAGIFAKILTGEEYTDQQLVEANYRAVSKIEEQKEQVRFDIESEYEDIYRHTYQEERQILEAVKAGNVDEAVRLSKEMDANIGRLGKSEVQHWRNLSIVSTTLCARAAIEGGVIPAIAYRISGFYINQFAECGDVTQILIYRNHAIEELARRVQEKQEQRHSSSYTDQCKAYVHRHYREKIYLEDIAGMLGISASYLSRTFKRETGVSLQEFINDVRVERAANLLIYSEESLPGIAEYVNFPSQSYFGKIFKQKMNMTPKQYRERYKPAEFRSPKKGQGAE